MNENEKDLRKVVELIDPDNKDKWELSDTKNFLIREDGDKKLILTFVSFWSYSFRLSTGIDCVSMEFLARSIDPNNKDKEDFRLVSNFIAEFFK